VAPAVEVAALEQAIPPVAALAELAAPEAEPAEARAPAAAPVGLAARLGVAPAERVASNKSG
jgi:hypothetical protein